MVFYEKANLKDEFCYCQYSDSTDSTVDYNLCIVPPVSTQEAADSTPNALVCTVEARYHKTGIYPPPHSMKDLLHDLQNLTVTCENFCLDRCMLFMGEDSDTESVEVMNEDGTIEPYQPTVVKFGLSRIDHYALLWKTHKSESTVSTGNVMTFDDVVKEIKSNGPVIASFLPDWDFSDWSMENARNFIYTGLYFAEPDEKKQHLVSLIGFGSGEKEYFIAQNSYGLNWGDNGMFRLDSSCVRCVSVPILQLRE